MRSQFRQARCKTRLYGGSRIPALLALLCLVAYGVLAYRHFFQRQGEAAAGLIPGDALAVVTLDLKPSPQQVPTFHRIQDSLQHEQVNGQFDSMLTALLSNSPLAKNLRPYITTSMAFAALKQPGAKTASYDDWVGLLAVSDSGRVRDLLAQNARKSTLDRIDYYLLKTGDKTCMTVVGDYFVIAARSADLIQIVRVHRGELAPITAKPAYQQARSALPADSNLMVFIPSDSVKQATTTVAGMQHNQGVNSVPWVAIGTSARPNGLETYVHIPVDAPPGSDLSHIAPLDTRLLKRLPSGAYGLVALSQPGKYGSLAHLDNITPSQTGLADFERETGMSIPREVLPALHGDALFAVYPDADGHSGADGLMVLDDTNSANPAALTDRVRRYIERQTARDPHRAVHFTMIVRNGVTLWTLDPNSQHQLQHALGDATNTAQQQMGLIPPGSTASPNTLAVAAPTASNVTIPSPDSPSFQGRATMVTEHPLINTSGTGGSSTTSITLPDGAKQTTISRSDGSFQQTMRNPNGTLRSTVTMKPNGSITTSFAGQDGTMQTVSSSMPSSFNAAPAVASAVGNKTLIYALVGHTVLIASSQHMLERALDVSTAVSTNVTTNVATNVATNASTRGGTLADEPAYAQMSRQMPAGTQSLLLIDLPGILEAFRPEVTRSMAGGGTGMRAEDVLGMFGHHIGIVGAEQYDGKVIRGYFFLPIDYEKMIRLIGAAQKAGGMGAAPPSPMSMTPPTVPTSPGQ